MNPDDMNGIVFPISDTEAAALALRELYLMLIAAEFTENEATKIIANYIWAGGGEQHD